MAVDFITSNPSSLLAEFKKRISQKEPEGKITTWALDSDGDFTHIAAQWNKKAWFRPKIKDGKLTFIILAPEGTTLPPEVYGYYHGHLTAAFLTHFGKSFSSAQSSGKPTVEDAASPAR